MTFSTQPGTTGAVAQAQKSVHIKSPLTSLEKAFLWCTLILWVGVIGCVVAVSNPLENLVNTISLALVAAGTVGASAFGWILSKRTAAAIAASNAEAKEALERAEVAALELERLRSFVAGRRITPEGVQIACQHLRSVPADQRTPIHISVSQGDPECHQLTEDIEGIFREVDWPYTTSVMIGGGSGVAILCTPELVSVASVVVRAFEATGTKVSAHADRRVDFECAQLVIRVGSRTDSF